MFFARSYFLITNMRVSTEEFFFCYVVLLLLILVLVLVLTLWSCFHHWKDRYLVDGSEEDCVMGEEHR